MIHLPIGLIIAAFGLELLFRKSSNPISLKSIRFLLGLAAMTAIISASLGYFLSQTGGYDSEVLFIHQWSGIALAFLISIFYLIRKTNKNGTVLRAGWGVILFVLTIAGHFGGSLTHGSEYLIESAPDMIRNIFISDQNKLIDKPLDSAIVFEDIIQPIIKRKCWSCHGNDKNQGRLNLQTVTGWDKGGKNGHLLKAGDPLASLILERVYLPIAEEKHMPPSGKPQLIASEVALLEWWIAQGGDFKSKISSLKRNQRIDQIIQPEFGNSDIYTELEVPSFDGDVLNSLQSAGIRILSAAQGTSFLEVNFSRDSLINPDRLKLLQKMKNNITRMDFSYSGVNNEQLEILGQFPNLVYLSLAGTTISDKGISHLKRWDNLQYLNLHSTEISDESLNNIESIPNLKKVFLWNTNTTEAALAKLIKSKPKLKVDY